MTSNGYITVVIVAGLALIGYLFGTAPTSAPTQMPFILTALGGFIVLLQKQGDTDKKVEENTAVTAAAKQAATGAVAAIEVVTLKQDTTNSLVDGHLSTITAKMDAMAAKIASMEQDKLIKANETEKIIGALTSAVPERGTPAHGTPIGGSTIAPGGPTTIIVDPDHPIAIEAEKKMAKGKRPKVGDQQ